MFDWNTFKDKKAFTHFSSYYSAIQRVQFCNHLQPQLGETRHQELRNSPFWHSSLFKSQLVKEREDFLLKKAPLKTLRVLDPIKTSPFVVPTRKEAPTGNAPMGATPLKAVTNHFPQVGGNQISEAQRAIF